MLGAFLTACMLMQAASAIPQTSPSVATAASATKLAQAPANPVLASGTDELLNVKRIYVDSFGEDVISKEMQSMIVSALVETKYFKVTENREHADAVLKGAALEKTSQELHAYEESTAVGTAGGGGHGEVNGSIVNGNGTISGSSSGGFAAQHMGTSDSSVNTETVSEARVAIRLVNAEGDVIWTTTQESRGAKYKGASADVADKCVKQLVHDIDKLRHAGPAGNDAPAATKP